jgi:hypothetical protein
MIIAIQEVAVIINEIPSYFFKKDTHSASILHY